MASIALLIITMLYPLLNTIWIFLVLRLFHGTAWGVSTTANSTMAVDSIPKARLGEGMGYFSVSTTVGAIVAPSLGILIYSTFSFHTLIWSSAFLSLFAIIMLSFVHATTPIQNDKRPFRFMEAIFEKK